MTGQLQRRCGRCDRVVTGRFCVACGVAVDAPQDRRVVQPGAVSSSTLQPWPGLETPSGPAAFGPGRSSNGAKVAALAAGMLVVALAIGGGVALAVARLADDSPGSPGDVALVATTSVTTSTTATTSTLPPPPPPPVPVPVIAPCVPDELLATANQQTSMDSAYSGIADVACVSEWASANLYSTTTEWTDSGALFERVEGAWQLRGDGISPFCPSELERYGAPNSVAVALAGNAGCEGSGDTIPDSEYVDSGPCLDSAVVDRYLERYADSLDAMLSPYPLLEGQTERTEYGQSNVYICPVLVGYATDDNVVDYIYFGINDPGPIALWATPVGPDFVANNDATTYTVSYNGLSVSGPLNFFQPWSYLVAD